MDVNDLRSGVTVLSMLVFLGIAAWAWSQRNRSRFDEAAQLPFQHDGSGEGEAR
ncbi:cbb3-type cytochrome oxidase subunit 3 [Rhizobacter sp. P5_C2]|jgi:cytochrome c oxidase cbb3-type subunit 4